MSDVDNIADAVVVLGQLAQRFALVNRTAVYLPDGQAESDTDHTVMLGWVACSLADRYFPELDVGLVAQLALVHDAPEIYAGDTPTLRISPGDRVAKAAREYLATDRIEDELCPDLAWLPDMIAEYSWRSTPEACFVCAVDKLMPKVVHLLRECRGLREQDMGVEELSAFLDKQRAEIDSYAGEFTELMALRDEMASRLLAALGAEG